MNVNYEFKTPHQFYRKPKLKKKNVILFILFNILFAIILMPFILFWGPFETLKEIAVGSVVISRHPQFVNYFLNEEQIYNITHRNSEMGVIIKNNIKKTQEVNDTASGIIIENISGSTYKGKAMLIRDPKRVKIAVTSQLGITGERVSDLVQKTGAIAGINGGGFYDPFGRGNGAFPLGLTMSGGKLLHNSVGDKQTEFVGLTDEGKLVIDTMSAAELSASPIKETMFFGPALIKDGKPQIMGSNNGEGLSPRTAIGQTADGTIIFVVIDGRQPTYSLGASYNDVMNIFIKYNAVNAYNLDGGSSTELFYNGKVINKLWNIYGERYLPTAFVVMPQ